MQLSSRMLCKAAENSASKTGVKHDRIPLVETTERNILVKDAVGSMSFPDTYEPCFRIHAVGPSMPEP